jgi:pimeloyl-ACP methyl ester carboxylesterase
MPNNHVRTRGVLAAVAGLTVVGALVMPTARATVPTVPATIDWHPCPDYPTAQCGTLRLPVDWMHPSGPSFGLAVARRTATDPGARIGSLVFGPGGPGDSGVDRIERGISRFSADLQRRFDVVSFDPRGIGGSNPVRCSSALLATQPAPVITSQVGFDATVAFNRRLSRDCRARTGPLYDHLDTLSLVHDLDALRAALGERTLTFHGSSYGTLLGEQYAEVFPRRVRALVLEGVVDHSLGTRAFLDTQAATEQDAFDQFVLWCGRTASCLLHERNVRAVWADLLARAGRDELPDPEHPGVRLTPYDLTVMAQKAFYNPDWAALDQRLAGLIAGEPAVAGDQTVAGEPTSLPVSATSDVPTSTYPFAVFCPDWNLPVRNYREYAAHLSRIARIAPDMRYPRALIAISTCLGTPQRVNNPQHRLKVHGAQTILLTNALHDPASGYNWATNVARQLGRQAVLLTYEGSSHGTYNSTTCARTIIDRYLIFRAVPPVGTRCPAIEPTSS